MSEDEPSLSQVNNSKGSSRAWMLIVVVIIGWVLLRIYAQSGVDSYNKCIMQAVSKSDYIKNATIAAGYSSSDATKASFDIYADQVYGCSKQRPSDWVIMITNVTAIDSN
jgi:hypothetical protein